MMDIEQYLRDNKPGMPEEGQFLVETNARLCNVEGVKKCVDEDLGCLVTLLVVFYPLPTINVNSSALAKAMAGLKEWEELLIALIAGCAIALGVVFMSRKKEAL